MNETPENSSVEEAPEEQAVNEPSVEPGDMSEAIEPEASVATSDETPDSSESEDPGSTGEEVAAEAEDTAETAESFEFAETAEDTEPAADSEDTGSTEDADASPESEEAFDFDGSFASDEDMEDQEPQTSAEEDGFDLQALENSGLFDDGQAGENAEVRAQPARFQELDDLIESNSRADIDMLLDISLPMVVELGRTKMLIQDILSLKSGSVITLDKLTGEPANLVINGKVMATGEIVVIDENFGIRVTNLVKPMDRLKEKN